MELRKIFKYSNLVIISALIVSIIGAYFSIYGISFLFSAKFLSVFIMGIALELLKVVTVGYLSLMWNFIKWIRKLYLVISVVILSSVTSTGIYSFLVSAFQENGNKVEVSDKKMEILKNKRDFYLTSANQIQKEVDLKNKRIATLNDLRNSQEKRLDDDSYNTQYLAQISIKNSDKQIIDLQKSVDALNQKIIVLNDSASKYDLKRFEEDEKQTIGNDVGTFKYLSNLLGVEIEKIVNFLVLFLIIVFDPLALTLISTVVMVEKKRKNKEETLKKENVFKNKIQKYVADEQGNFKLEDKIIPIVEKSVAKTLAVKDPVIEEKPIVAEEYVTEECPVVIEDPIIEEQPIVVEESVTEEYSAVDEPSIVKEPLWQEEIVSEEPIMQRVENKTPTVELNVIKEPEILNVDNWKKQSLYLRLLEIFYKDGEKKAGEEVPSYTDFKNMIDKKLKNVNEKDIKDFLVICNLFRITEFKDNVGFFEKEYSVAFDLVSKI